MFHFTNKKLFKNKSHRNICKRCNHRDNSTNKKTRMNSFSFRIVKYSHNISSTYKYLILNSQVVNKPIDAHGIDSGTVSLKHLIFSQKKSGLKL